ncbi:MAG: PKD domain-containing protein [Bacteroidia bacterium]|nr:PKD domain-containing protein [Bacteroidia bacterium]
MKKLLFAFLLGMLAIGARAQVCNPDTNQTFTSNYPKTWKKGCVGVPYEEYVYFAFPKDTTVVINVTFISFEILQENLPPGLTYSCNVSNCKWTPTNTTLGPDHILACMKIHGTPTQAFGGVVDFDIEGCGQTAFGVQCSTDPQHFNLTIYTQSLPGFTYTTGAGNTVNFTNTTVHGTAPAYSFNWDFGDGNTSSAESPTHTYASPGTYTACMTLSNNCTDTTVCETIVITGNDPEAVFADWEAFPNPAHDRLSVSGSLRKTADLQVNMVDLSGKSVVNREFPATHGNFRTDLSLNGIAPGLYFLEMSTSEGRSVRKVVIR